MSVEHDHPQALEFLIKDCSNVTEFFRRKEVSVMTVKELFDFVTDLSLTDDQVDEYLKRIEAKTVDREPGGLQSAEEEVSEAVFKQIFIPRTLQEVERFEEDFHKMSIGEGQDIVYSTVTGLKPDLSGAQSVPELLQEQTVSDEDGTNDECESEEDSEEDSDGERRCSDSEQDEVGREEEKGRRKNRVANEGKNYLHPRGHKKGGMYNCTLHLKHTDHVSCLDPHELELKRAHKTSVKEEKREKRKTKIPKHTKKRKEKVWKQRHSK